MLTYNHTEGEPPLCGFMKYMGLTNLFTVPLTWERGKYVAGSCEALVTHVTVWPEV